jgi:polyisoprenoid-binding protein YceI
MRKAFFATSVAVFVSALTGAAPAHAAESYAVDGMHTAVTFKISHLGLSWVHGRFNDVAGTFTIDPADAGKSSFAMDIKTESIDTGNKQRDDHLRSPDFFSVKQFPAMSFKSTAVKPIDGGYEVTGDLTLHGVTRRITFPLKGGRMAEFPKGVQRTGYSTELSLKRSDFGMEKLLDAVGNDIYIAVSFEGVKK